MANTELQKLILTVIVGLFLLWHLSTGGWKGFDSIALALLFIAVLPWLASILEIAELPGGIKFKFNQIRKEQERQAEELEWIRLLTDLVISDYERIHLRNLAAEGPAFETEIKKGSTFEWELRHLVTLGLIERLPGKGFRTLFSEEGKRNVKEHLRISDRGRKYLRVVEQVKSPEEA